MTSYSANQGYQGYPYRNPTVTEVYSGDPNNASRWTNIPQTQNTERRADKQNGNINSTHGSTRLENSNIPKKHESDDEVMNVYIDLPSTNSDDINQRRHVTNIVQNQPNSSCYQGYPYRNPIPTDVQSVDPEIAYRWANLPSRTITDGSENRNRSTLGHGPSKQNQESNNLEGPSTNIYIDIPIINPQDINRRRDETRSGEDNTGFVEDTIFYDPFEDRRINDSRNLNSQVTDTSIAGSSSLEARATIPGSSSGSDAFSQARTPSRIPPFMSKESYIYQSRTPEEDFSLSPIPVSDFPEPPPAYSEVDRRIEVEPPRTVVVVPDRNIAVGIASVNRKLLRCPHCSLQVHTLPVQENGVITHVLAFIFIFVFAPITLLIYCTDFCKYMNHYCPNCNQLIGYEVPILCQDMVYNKP